MLYCGGGLPAGRRSNARAYRLRGFAAYADTPAHPTPTGDYPQLLLSELSTIVFPPLPATR